MLKEFDRIAREMLFLHGHLTKPSDLTMAGADDARTSGGQRAPSAPRKRTRRMAAVTAACAVVMPTRLIVGQLR